MQHLPIQIYNGKKDNTGQQTTIEKALWDIEFNSELEVKILKLRQKKEALNNATDATQMAKLEADIEKIKGALPAVTWSGTFTKRKADALKEYTGLMCLDIDSLNPDRLTQLHGLIMADPHTAILFISPSGNGLKVIVPIQMPDGPDIIAHHKEMFLQLEQYYLQTFGVAIDKSGKDVCRLCFLSADDKIYYNPSVEQFSKIYSITPSDDVKEKPFTASQSAELYNHTETTADVFEFTQRVLPYTQGNRNRFIYLFANNCNRKGISMADCSQYAFANFTDREPEELRQTIENAYNNNSQEFGKYARRNGPRQGSNSNGKPHQHEQDFKPFWRKYKVKKGTGDDAYEVERIELSRVDFSDFLFSQGFHLMHTGKDGYQLCHSANGVVKPVDPHMIKQNVLRWCKQNGHKDVNEMLRKGQKQYFAFNELDSLEYKHIEIKRDTADTAFFYFNNCWVSVTANDITTHPYSELDKYIWEGNKINHDFTLEDTTVFSQDGSIDFSTLNCEFARFIYYFGYNPKNEDEKNFTPAQILERFSSIACAYGFLLDGYKHPAIRKGIFAIDHKVGDRCEQNGRTGKSIIPAAAGYLKKVSTINGKSFNPQYQFKYEVITMDSQIVNFNDMQRNFDVETIFEVIADNYAIIRRNNGYIEFEYKESPKVYFSTNFIPKGEGSSYSGRMHVIEASDYFNDEHSPYDEFGHSLFTDWDKAEWNRFYNFSLLCVRWHKENGLVPYPAGNLDRRKLVNDVVPEFIDWMDESTHAPRNTRLCKIDLLQKFNDEIYFGLYGQKLKPHTFHKWVKQYAKNRGLGLNPRQKGGYDKSNGKEYYTLADEHFTYTETELNLFNQQTN